MPPVLHALLGTVAWTASVVLLRPSWALALLLLAPFVTVPLGLRLAATPNRQGIHPASWRAAIVLQLPAAIALAVSFRFPTSRLAAGLAAPWLVVTMLAAMFGARRFFGRGARPSEELCIDVAMLFLLVGGVWAVLIRAFAQPLGFDPLVGLLTATHFHYAGFALCLLVGLAGRKLPRGAPRLVVALVFSGVVGLAVGIGGSWPRVEMVAGFTLALGGFFVAAMHLHLATMPGRPATRVLLALSGLSLAAALVLATLFAARGIRVLFVPWIVDLGRMARLHGTANAIGFALLGLLAWAAAPPAAHAGAPGLPFSALGAGLRVGSNFFERRRVAVFAKDPPRGLVDSLDAHARGALATERVHASVRAFYERTDEHELIVRPRWHPLFRFGARIFRVFARFVGQLQLPIDAERASDRIDSRIVALDPARDGRPGARGWVRSFARDGTAMYVAAYATHVHDAVAYMNIAFPLPFGNLTSVLRMDALFVGGPELAIELTTRGPSRAPSDAGIWIVARGLGAVRLPMHETIRVWAASTRLPPHAIDTTEMPGATVLARHELWLLGIRYLTLDYVIRPKPNA
jgi:hypothetical protein